MIAEVDFETLEIVIQLLVTELAKPLSDTQRPVDRLAKVIGQLPILDQFQKGIVSNRVLAYGEKDPAGIANELLINLIMGKYA